MRIYCNELIECGKNFEREVWQRTSIHQFVLLRIEALPSPVTNIEAQNFSFLPKLGGGKETAENNGFAFIVKFNKFLEETIPVIHSTISTSFMRRLILLFAVMAACFLPSQNRAAGCPVTGI